MLNKNPEKIIEREQIEFLEDQNIIYAGFKIIKLKHLMKINQLLNGYYKLLAKKLTIAFPSKGGTALPICF